MPSTIRHRERLGAPFRWWVQTTMLLATFWLACVVAMPLLAAWLVTGLLGLIAAVLLWWTGRVLIEVTDSQVRAGGATIEPHLLGEVETLDAAATRRVHGVEANARAFLVMRPYVKRSVLVRIADPADSTPYWLLGTRRPEDLAEALRVARDRSASSPESA